MQADHLIITVHGIRTFGHWQRRLEQLLVARASREERHIHSIDYGYFSVIAFFLPFVRWLATRRVRRLLLRSMLERPWRRIDIVAHSFGTHLVGWALQGLAPEERRRLRIHTIIFAGSVLHPRFPWHQLMDEATGCVDRVVSDCGTKDGILLLSQTLVPLMSMAGRAGFRGVMNDRFRNRFFTFGHSGYFVTGGEPNSFMETWWVPLLTTDQPITPHDERSSSAVAGLVAFLINNAEPLKLAGYAAAIYFLIYAPIAKLQMEREQARQGELVGRLADAAVSASGRDEDIARALLLARQAYLYNGRFRTDRAALVDRALRAALGVSHASVPLLTSRGDLTAASFSADGRWLAVADDQRTVRLWEPDKPGYAFATLGVGNGVVRALRFAPDSKRLVAVTDTGVALFWEIPGPERPAREVDLVPGGDILSFALSHDAQWFAAGFADGRIRLWELGAGPGIPVELCCHARAVSVIAFHPRLHDTIASGSQDRTVRVWQRAHADAPLLEFREPETPVSALAWSSDGRVLAAGTTRALDIDAAVWVGDIFARPPGLRALGRHKAMVKALDFSADGHLLAAAGSGDRTVRLWPLRAGDKPPVSLSAHAGAATGAIFDPRGRYLVSLDAGDPPARAASARLWHLGEPPGVPLLLKQHGGPVTELRFAPGGSLLASVGGLDATLALYDVAAGKTVARFKHDEARAESLSFSPDGNTIATGSSSPPGADKADFTVRLWDIASKAPVPRAALEGPASAVKAVAFSSDGQWLAYSGHFDREIHLRHPDGRAEGSRKLSTGKNQVLALAFRPGAPLLAWAGTEPGIHLANVAKEASAPAVLSGHAMAVTALAFTSDGSRMASGSLDKTILLWNSDRPQDGPLARMSQPVAVTSIALDSTGRELASGGNDGRVRIWELKLPTAEPRQLDGPGGNRLSVALSADGRYVAAGGLDGKIAVWNTTRFLAEQACFIARRNLTQGEWRAEIGGKYECTCEALPPCGPRP